MSGPLGSQGQNRSALELDRIISRLNDDFALQLRKPDVTLSPRKYREPQRSDEEARIDDIYQKIQQLHYRGGNRLADCLGLFQIQGRLILSDAESLSPTRYLSNSLRALLQERLLKILCDINGPESRQLSKRISEGTANHSQKRPKGPPPHSYEHHDAVDALPVRSTGSFADSGISLSSGSRSIGEVIQPLPQQTSFDRTFGSSRASFRAEVFSSKNTQDVSFVSQTTVDPGYDMSNRHPYSRQTSAESFSHSFGLSQSRNDVQQNQNSLPSRPNKSTNQLEYPDDSRFKSPLPSLKRSSQDSVGSASQTIDERLANIWPKLPIPALTHAPLAVIWEITRAALHCKVSLDEFDLLYEPNDSWHDQSSLRDAISRHHLFHGQSLPPSSDSVAWHTALGDFQTKVKTVTLSADLVYNQNSTGPLYSLRLHPLKLELGHRLARRFGADRFLEITIPSPSWSWSADEEQPNVLKEDPRSLEKIVDWLTKPEHYFLGRTWKPFFVRSVKGKKISGVNRNTSVERVYFFACDGNNFRPSAADGISPLAEALETKARTKMKLSGLLKWAIGIDNELNSEQPVTKLFSRLALSLSRTWPTVVLERHQIINKPEDLMRGGKIVMNDGIGRISPSLAKKVAVALGLSDCPSCFQGRLGSAKGMWLVDVESEEDFERDWVETYPSQRKWKCDFQDPHHRTLEIRNWPSELRSASLNQQFIPVLEARSPQPDAMRRVISEHLQRALHAELGDQAAAMKEPMSLRLWIHQSGPSKTDRSLDGSTKFLASLPDNTADRVAFLLDSGFDQRRMDYLRELVWEMCKKKADILKTKMNITIPCSAYIYMVADFSSTLEEGEVHLSFSTKFQAEGFSDTLLENMDILVARAPAHLPSDIQRVRVVSRPELRKLKDVIIFSTRGSIPLADKLSGGDYDGDMAWVCWDQNIVRNFDNAALPQKLDFIESGYLRKVTTQFKDILDNVGRNNHRKYMNNRTAHLQDACVEFVSRAFLFNLQPSFLGRCTKYKEKLCYMRNSVQDRDAIHLSQLLGYLVDQSKQGIEFTEEDWKRFCTQHLGKKSTSLPIPEYAKEKGSRMPDSKGRLHILDYLKFDVADKVIDEVLTSFNETIKANNAIHYDEDLTKLCNVYEEREKTSAGCKQLLTYLRGQIGRLHEEWGVISRENSKFATKADSMYQKWLDIQLPAELGASGEFPELVHDSNKNSALSNWELLKASTAFKNHYNHGYKFVWYMAGKQLGFIKAMAHRVPGETSKVMVIPEMWGVLRPDKKLITSLGLQREAARDSESALALEEVFDFDDNGTVIDDA
ncbi:RNA dependent RNA polymerase domain-containing protein [Trichoderma compactum]